MNSRDGGEREALDSQKVIRCVAALQDDHARQSGHLSADDAARLIDRRGLGPSEAAEVWRRLEELALVSTPAAAAGEWAEAAATHIGAVADAAHDDVNLLGQFITDIRHTPILSENQTADLAHRIRVGRQAEYAVQEGCARIEEMTAVIEAGRAARNRFIESNLRLVVFFAKEFFSIPGVNKLDLIQDGTLGLMTAVERFEPARGYRFASYAVWWIRQKILAGLATQTSVISLPTKVASLVRRVERKRRQFERENGRSPGLVELALEAELDPATVRFIQQIAAPLSLETPAPGTDDLTLGDSIRDTSLIAKPDEGLHREEMVEAVRRNLAPLSQRDRAIMARRFGLDTDEEATLQEIGEEFGLSRERVRQIIDKYVEQFRRRPDWKQLR